MSLALLPIAHYVLLAEFDIDTGSCIRATYPPLPLTSSSVTDVVSLDGGNIIHDGVGSAEEEKGVHGSQRWHQSVLHLDRNYCASHMLPDGAEKQVVTRTVFVTNRPKPVIIERFPVYYFTLGTTLIEGTSTRVCGKNSGDLLDWVRNAVSDDLFVGEELHCNEASDTIWISSDGTVVFGPVNTAALEVYFPLPKSVFAFAHKLRLRSLQCDVDESARNGFFFVRRNEPLLTSAAVSSLPLSLTPTDVLGYSFAVVRNDSICHGFLLKTSDAEWLTRPRKEPRSVELSGRKKMDVGSRRSSLASSEKGVPTTPPLFGLCAVVTLKDASVRRGGISKSVALLGPTLAWLEPFFPLLVETAHVCCNVKGKAREALETQAMLLKLCFDAVDAVNNPLKESLQKEDSFLEMKIMRICARSSRSTHVSCSISPFVTLHELRLPMSPELSEFTFSRYGLEHLVEAFGASFWTIVVAILLEKRVVILSRQGLPNDVSEAALSLGLIGNLVDPKFTSTRVFPCTSVNGFSHFSNVPGYIVGTLNPIFETQQSWWDVLCDLDNKCVLLSSEEKSSNGNLNKCGGACGWEGVETVADPTAKHDIQFSRYILGRLCRMRAMREPLCELHRAVLLLVEEYLGLMIAVCERHEVFGYNIPRCIQEFFFTPIAARLRACVRRGVALDGMLRSELPFLISLLFPESEASSILISAATLRRAGSCDESELLQALKYLLVSLKSPKEVLLFLRCMPVALDGLNPLAAQLLHPSLAVRQAARELIRRVEVLPPGKAASEAMNSFFSMVYEKAFRDEV